jgi:hypothetical protein
VRRYKYEITIKLSAVISPCRTIGRYISLYHVHIRCYKNLLFPSHGPSVYLQCWVELFVDIITGPLHALAAQFAGPAGPEIFIHLDSSVLTSAAHQPAWPSLPHLSTRHIYLPFLPQDSDPVPLPSEHLDPTARGARAPPTTPTPSASCRDPVPRTAIETLRRPPSRPYAAADKTMRCRS